MKFVVKSFSKLSTDNAGVKSETWLLEGNWARVIKKDTNGTTLFEIF